MVFRSRVKRTLAEFDRALSADATLARLATLFAEPPRPVSRGRRRSAVPRRLARWPTAPRRKVFRVFFAVVVLASLGGAVAFAVAGPPGPAVICGIVAGAGAIWLITEVVGGKVAAPFRHRRRRPWSGQAHRRWTE